MKLPDHADNLAAVLVLGFIGIIAVLHAVPVTSTEIAKDIAIGLIGFLAKAAVTQPPEGPNP